MKPELTQMQKLFSTICFGACMINGFMMLISGLIGNWVGVGIYAGLYLLCLMGVK